MQLIVFLILVVLIIQPYVPKIEHYVSHDDLMANPLRTRMYHIGLYRCGTQSIAHMFKKVHLHSVHEYKSNALLAHIHQYQKTGNLKRFHQFLLHRERSAAFPDVIDVDSNGAFILCYRVLYKLNPKAWFLITLRDGYSWINSLYNKNLAMCRQEANCQFIESIVHWGRLFRQYGTKLRFPSQAIESNDYEVCYRYIFEKHLETVVRIYVDQLDTLVHFSKDKKNVLFVPLNKLSSRKVRNMLQRRMKTPVLHPIHTNKQTIQYVKVNKHRFDRYLCKHEVSTTRDIYKKFGWLRDHCTTH